MKLFHHTPMFTVVVATCGAALSVGASSAIAQRASHHMHIYKGTGVITAVDAEGDVFTVDFTKANRALRNTLGGDLGNVYVSIDQNTHFSINGDGSLDTSDLCEGDEVTVVIKTPERISGHDLTDHPAAVVEAEAEEGECED